jgi:hypothetical protein
VLWQQLIIHIAVYVYILRAVEAYLHARICFRSARASRGGSSATRVSVVSATSRFGKSARSLSAATGSKEAAQATAVEGRILKGRKRIETVPGPVTTRSFIAEQPDPYLLESHC